MALGMYLAEGFCLGATYNTYYSKYIAVYRMYFVIYMLHHNNQTLKLGPFEFLEASDHTIVRQEDLFRGKLFLFVSF